MHSALVPIKGLQQFKPFVDWLRVAMLVKGTSVIERANPDQPVYTQVLRWLQLHFPEYWTDIEAAAGWGTPPKFQLLYKAI